MDAKEVVETLVRILQGLGISNVMVSGVALVMMMTFFAIPRMARGLDWLWQRSSKRHKRFLAFLERPFDSQDPLAVEIEYCRFYQKRIDYPNIATLRKMPDRSRGFTLFCDLDPLILVDHKNVTFALASYVETPFRRLLARIGWSFGYVGFCALLSAVGLDGWQRGFEASHWMLMAVFFILGLISLNQSDRHMRATKLVLGHDSITEDLQAVWQSLTRPVAGSIGRCAATASSYLMKIVDPR